MYENLNVAVIGDIMLDHWREGADYKLSPEGPHIDVRNPESEYSLGGAGNVARMVSELGASVYLLGVLGTFSGEENCRISDLCRHSGITKLYEFEDRRTTVKERVEAHGRTLCRVSTEDTYYVSVDTVNKLIDLLKDIGRNADIIIVADYSKGVMRDQLITPLLELAKKNNIPTLMDPKNRLYIYKGCTIMKPNQKEYDKLAEGDSMELTREKLECEAFVVTSEHGMHFTTESGTGFLPAHPVEVANVSGCGDAAAAVMALEYVRSNHDIERSVKLANWAASRVVQRERTGHLDIKDLEEFYERGETTEGDLSG